VHFSLTPDYSPKESEKIFLPDGQIKLSAKCPLFLKNVHHQKLQNKKKTIKTQETIFEVDIPARVNLRGKRDQSVV
jgi:hypothetical protein